MGRIVVTEFVSLDGVMEDPGGSERSKHGAWTFKFNRGDEGNRFKKDETNSAEAQLLGQGDLRGLCRGLAPKEWRSVLGKVQQHAQVRHLPDAEEGRLEQLDDPQGERRGGGLQTEADAEGRYPHQRQR